MTALFMILIMVLHSSEVFLFFIILKAIYSDINYKYAFIITLVSACCTTFINQISLFSAFSVIIFVLSTFIGGCILVRKDYFMLLSISAFYVLMMGCYEFCYASLIMHFSSYGADYLTLILIMDGRVLSFRLPPNADRRLLSFLYVLSYGVLQKKNFMSGNW